MLPARVGWEGPADEVPAGCLHDQHDAQANATLFLLSSAAVHGGEPCAPALGQGRRLPAIPDQQLCQGGLEDLPSQQLGAGPHPSSSCLRMVLVPSVTLAVPERKCWRALTPTAQAGQALLGSSVGRWR